MKPRGSLRLRGSVWWTRIYFDGVRVEQSTGTSDEMRARVIFERRRRASLLPEGDPALSNAIALIQGYIDANRAKERPHGPRYKLRKLLREFNVAVRTRKRHDRQIREAAAAVDAQASS